jgi:hypothetical protein
MQGTRIINVPTITQEYKIKKIEVYCHYLCFFPPISLSENEVFFPKFRRVSVEESALFLAIIRDSITL